MREHAPREGPGPSLFRVQARTYRVVYNPDPWRATPHDAP